MVQEQFGAPSQANRKTSLSRRAFNSGAVAAGAGVTLGLSSSLAASESQHTPRRARAAQDKVKITFMSRGGEYISGVVDQQIAAFNEIYPDIEIRQEAAAGDFVQKI